MPSNTTLNSGTGGDGIVTKEVTHDGDVVKLQGVSLLGVSGTEDAYTIADINGDATNGLDVDVTRLPALVAGTANIGDVDVLTLPAIPAGDNNIGNVDVVTLPALVAGTANIGDVDVLSVVPGTGASNLGKEVDTPRLASDVGVEVLGVRNDTPGSLVTVDGDYAPFQVDSLGRLRIAVDAIAPGDNNIGNVDVVTLPAIPAGSNNIGDVDVLTVPAPLSTTGGGTEATALRVTVASDSTGVLSVDDNGGSLTVDGTVSVTGAVDTELTTDDLDTGVGTDTRAVVGIVGSKSGGAQLIPGDATAGLKVDLGADNDVTVASIAAGDNNIGNVDVVTLPPLVAGSANIGDVDILTVPAPLNTTGGGTEAAALRVTIANDSTGVVSVDDNGGSITVDGAITANAGTNLNTSALALEAGGNLATVAGAVKAEDAVHGTGDSGVMALGVRKDTGAAIAGTDGDYSPLQVDSSGNLRVNVAAGGAGDGAILDGVTSSIKATVLDFTNSNPLAVRLSDTNGDYVAAGAGTQYTEDDAAAVNPVGGQTIARRRDSLASETTTDGDNTALNCTAKGELYVKQTDAVPVTDNSGSLTVDNAGTFAVQVSSALPLGSNNIGDVDVLTLPSLPTGSNNIGDVDVLTLPALVAGTANIGDVDVLTVIPGVGATNLGKAIDTAAGATDTGVAILAVRDDALTALTPIETDYVPLRTDANGAVWTHDDVLDAALAGSELQVDVVGALPAGTNAIGKLVANSGVDIGDVDVTSIAPGDNNIGNVDVVTLPALVAGTANIGDVDVLTLPAIPAGTNLIGKVSAGADVTNRYDGSTALPVVSVNIDTATTGNNEIVAAEVGKTIVVISVALFASGAVDVYFNDGTANLLGGTRKIRLDNTGAVGALGFVLPEHSNGNFRAAGSNRPINLNLSAAIGVCGTLSYVKI